MPSTIIPSLIRFGINTLARSGGDPIKAVQNAVTTVQQSVDTFAAYAKAGAAQAPAYQSYPGAPAGEPLAQRLQDINIGVEGQTRDPVGPNDRAPHGVEIVQRFLERSGYLKMGKNPYGTYDKHTKEAVEQFQRDNGLNVSGVVDNATLSAMVHPRPRAGYGLPTTQGSLDLSRGTPTLQQTAFPGAASFYREQLGLPTSAAMMRLDGSVVQTFERGSLMTDPQGQLHLLNAQGTNVFTPPDYAAITERAAHHSINQLKGDNDGSNNNCGYASTNMVLSYLGVPGWNLEGVSDKEGYLSTMKLREMGEHKIAETNKDWKLNDHDESTPPGIIEALQMPEMLAAGVHVERWDNVANAPRAPDVEKMRLSFMNGDNPSTFVVAGNPNLGWGDDTSLNSKYWGNDVYDGIHFVAVVGYDPKTDKFLVLDPMATEPIEVNSQQMAGYMQDDVGVTHGEVLQVTYNPPESPAQP